MRGPADLGGLSDHTSSTRLVAMATSCCPVYSKAYKTIQYGHTQKKKHYLIIGLVKSWRKRKGKKKWAASRDIERLPSEMRYGSNPILASDGNSCKRTLNT